MSEGTEINLFSEIHLIFNTKFGDSPLVLLLFDSNNIGKLSVS